MDMLGEYLYRPPAFLCSYDGGTDMGGAGGASNEGGGQGDTGTTGGSGGYGGSDSGNASIDSGSVGDPSQMSFSSDVNATPMDVTAAIGSVGLAGYAAATGSPVATGFAIAAGAGPLSAVAQDFSVGIGNLGVGVSANPGGFGGFGTTVGGYTDNSGTGGPGDGGASSWYDAGRDNG